MIRLVVGVFVVVASSVWLATRMSRAVWFRPGLGVLALRVEKQFPEMAGKLACGVELATDHAHRPDSAAASALAALSVRNSGHLLDGIALRRLISTRAAARSLGVVVIVAGIVAAVVATVPQASALAARRWVLPLGQARWPRHTQVRSMVPQSFWPVDTPLPLTAGIERGYEPGMRAWATYRVTAPDGEASAWNSVLMSEQQTGGPDPEARNGAAHIRDRPGPNGSGDTGIFEILIEPQELDTGQTDGAQGLIEFYFEAGDDRTPVQSLDLVTRPRVDEVELTIDPPAYARGLVSPQHTRLEAPSGAAVAASGLRGSRVEMSIRFNRSVPVPAGGLGPFLPGFQGHEAVVIEPAFTEGHAMGGMVAAFVLDRTVETRIQVTDGRGLVNVSDRRYRLEALEDHPPVVSLVEPQHDQTVLPRAVVLLDAVGQDDIAVESLALDAEIRRGSDRQPGPGDDPDRVTLNQVTGRQSRLNLRHELDLEPLALRLGQEVYLTAVGQDVYELNGARHDRVVSKPRVLRVIDEAAFLREIRGAMVDIHRRASGLDDQQRKVQDQPVGQARPGQQRLTRGLAAQSDRLAQLQDRVARNRYDDPALEQLTQRASEALEAASSASRRAHQLLSQTPETQPQKKEAHEATIRHEQEQVRDALTQLMKLLDQGRHALALQSRLGQMQAQQQALADDVRRLLPQTVGRPLDQLDPQTRQALDELAKRQTQLAKQANELVETMKQVADALSKQDQNPNDQAMASALSQAAAIGRQQGLALNMQLGAEKIDENKLSSAGGDQQAALEVMQRMLNEMNNLEHHRQAVLRRRLMQLEQAIRALLTQQQAHLERLLDAVRLDALADALGPLRGNTLAVAQEAAEDEQTQGVAEPLEQAGSSQAQAIESLRQTDRDRAVEAERQAVSHLESALERVIEKRRQAEAQQMAQKRQKLREKYEKLAKKQEDLRKQTTVQLAAEDRSRQWRMGMIDLGHLQEDIRIETNKLQAQAGPSLVFTHLHRQIDQTATSVVSSLRSARPTGELATDQLRITEMLRSMAQALESGSSDDGAFAGGSGGGGGGSGSGGEPVLVPPLAELKLLRQLQQSVYQQTRGIDPHFQSAPPTDAQKQALNRLSDQQRELARLGRHMIEQMTRQLPPGPRPPNGELPP